MNNQHNEYQQICDESTVKNICRTECPLAKVCVANSDEDYLTFSSRMNDAAILVKEKDSARN